MTATEVPIEVKALGILADHLENASNEIRELMKAKMPEEFKAGGTPIMTKNGLLLADFLIEPKHARLEVKKELPWSEEMGVCGWLLGQLKKHATEHKGEIFKVEDQAGKLKAIDFPNGVQNPSPFINWFGWALNRLWEQTTPSPSPSPSPQAPQK